MNRVTRGPPSSGTGADGVADSPAFNWVCSELETRTTLDREYLHQDPNLNHAVSVAVVLSRLARSEKLTPIETMKLAAGEVAGEKSIKTLAEVIDTLNQNPDITKRFGQKGRGSATWAEPCS